MNLAVSVDVVFHWLWQLGAYRFDFFDDSFKMIGLFLPDPVPFIVGVVLVPVAFAWGAELVNDHGDDDDDWN